MKDETKKTYSEKEYKEIEKIALEKINAIHFELLREKRINNVLLEQIDVYKNALSKNNENK